MGVVGLGCAAHYHHHLADAISMSTLLSVIEGALSIALVVAGFIVIGWYMTGGPKE